MNPSDILTKETISAALRRLKEVLREKGVVGEFCIMDHATRVIAFKMRNSGHDGEAVSVSKQTVLDSAREVAVEFEIDGNWMNPSATGFISEAEEVTHDGITILYYGNHRPPTRLMASCQKTTLHESMLMVGNSVDFDDALANFLDRFNESPSTEMLVDEPDLFKEQFGDNGRADTFLAATAAWLANKNRLPVPAWAKGASRALESPWFAARSHKLRILLLQESPSEFRLRNLFVSANALHRA